MIGFIAAFLLSLIFGLYATPVMAKAATQMRIVDRPGGRLKGHAREVPYLGGLAVFTSFLLTVGVLSDFEQETLGLLLSATIILMVGLIDDFGIMDVWQKLLGQTLAALVLVKSGIYIRLEFVPTYIALPLTVLWILAVTNAFNIIDVLDGLAAGVGAVAALILAVANMMADRDSFAFLCVALAGATLGFLRYNFHPARIYLGDAGSLFLGFMLAALSMNAGYTRINLLAAIAPVLILGIPLFDLAFVVYVRWRKKLPVTQGSPDHFALRLRQCRLTVRETAVTTYAATLVLGGAALVMSQVTLEWALVTVTGTVLLGVVFAFLLLKVDVESRPTSGAVRRAES